MLNRVIGFTPWTEGAAAPYVQSQGSGTMMQVHGYRATHRPMWREMLATAKTSLQMLTISFSGVLK